MLAIPKKDIKASLDASKTGLEANKEKTKYIFMFHYQDVGQTIIQQVPGRTNYLLSFHCNLSI
jgi:hypothetical protein